MLGFALRLSAVVFLPLHLHFFHNHKLFMILFFSFPNHIYFLPVVVVVVCNIYDDLLLVVHHDKLQQLPPPSPQIHDRQTEIKLLNITV